MSDIFDKLKAEFPRDAISWRAQSMKADGSAAMALAYIDARDVMNRLDDVCGPGGWQDRYEFHGARTVCYLSILSEGEWITKADGAGDTDVEAEKGGISDAFKRAAVKWGIGRYLYDLPAPWVDCESYERGGKRYWKSWKQDPWSKVRTPSAPMPGRNAAGANSPPPEKAPAAPLSGDASLLDKALRMAAAKAETQDDLRTWWADQVPKAKTMLPPEAFEALKQHVTGIAANLPEGVPA